MGFIKQIQQCQITKNPTRYTVESGISIPSRNSGRNLKYPFNLLKVGDSFAVPLSNCKIKGQVNGAAHVFAKNEAKAGKNWKFVTRQIDRTVRVFRVS